MQHTWETAGRNGRFLTLQGVRDAIVDTTPDRNGQYLWQFRRVASFAATISEAKEFVEAGAEYFDVMRRNPYGAT